MSKERGDKWRAKEMLADDERCEAVKKDLIAAGFSIVADALDLARYALSHARRSDISPLVARMHESVMDTEAAGRPEGSLYNNWIELRNAVEAHLRGEQSGDVRKSETAQAGVGTQKPRDGSTPSAPSTTPQNASASTVDRLADLPRFLHMNGHRTLATIVQEELEKHRAALALPVPAPAPLTGETPERIALWLDDAANDGLTSASTGDQHNFRVAANIIRRLERDLADANAAAAHYVRDEPVTPRRALVRQATEIERLKGELAECHAEYKTDMETATEAIREAERTASATRRTHDVLLAITHGYTEWEATGDSDKLVKAINEAEVHRQEIAPPQTVAEADFAPQTAQEKRMVKRLDPSTLATPGGDPDDISRFVESDFKIRSGACPNNCGLMGDTDFGQECPKCHFSTNVRAEREGAN